MTEAQQRAYDQAQVMLAFSQGKKIQYRGVNASEYVSWMDIHPTGEIGPTWDWNGWDYRIAPEPQEVWLWVHKDGGVVADGFHSDSCVKQMGYTKKLFREVC